MKLGHSTWVPSQVANWLIQNLEEKGIPGENCSQTLLNLLYPYFYPILSLKRIQFNEESNQRISQVEFDDSVDSDADFPSLTSSNTAKTDYFNKEKFIEPLSRALHDQYKRIGVEYLLSLSDKSEGFELLIEKLLVRLESLFKENDKIQHDSNKHLTLFNILDKNFSNSQDQRETQNPPPYINNNEPLRSNSVKSKTADMSYDKRLIDPSIMPSDGYGILNALESFGSKEEWEMSQFAPNDKQSPEADSHRLFERAGSTETKGDRLFERQQKNNSKSFVEMEPWEQAIALKDDDVNVNVGHNENAWNVAMSLPSVSSVWKTDIENNSYNLFSNIGSKADNREILQNLLNEDNKRVDIDYKPLNPVGANQTKFLDREQCMQDLTDSMLQIKIDVWKNSPDANSSDEISGFGDISNSSSLSKIPKGPSGPYATLNHTETSGFSTVVPQRIDMQTDKTIISPRHLSNKATLDKENLLTSPRTHFRPIKQENQGENNDEEKCEELQTLTTATTEFRASEGIFHRTGSGNLVIESENARGTPMKYMVFKDHVKAPVIGTPDGIDSSPVTINDSSSTSFLPKFKISNNEKFCQTDDPNYINPIDVSKDIWKTSLTDGLKKIWSEDQESNKEIWELEGLPFSYAAESDWSRDGQFDESLDGPNILSKIRMLWQSASKDSDNSSREPSVDKASTDYLTFPNVWNVKNPGTNDQVSNADWPKPKEEPKKYSLMEFNEKEMEARWAKWSEAKEYVPKAEKNEEICPKPNDEPDPLEDLANLEPNWNFNDGFEWDPPCMMEEFSQTNLDETETDGDVLYYEYNGQTIKIPVEYLEDDCYEEMFGSTDSSIGGSMPDLPQGPVDETKKLFKIKKKNGKISHSRRPCTFFLEGSCLRTDCKFSHDLSSITCRFWEEDSCFKAETCPFLHGYPRRRNLSEGDQVECLSSNLKFKESKKSSKARAIAKAAKKPTSPFEISSEADFPSLGSSYDSKTNSFEELSKVTFSKSASLGKKKKFINIPKHFLKEIEIKRDSNCKGRRRKTKDSKRRSYNSSEFSSKCSKQESLIQSFSQHEDGTVSDY